MMPKMPKIRTSILPFAVAALTVACAGAPPAAADACGFLAPGDVAALFQVEAAAVTEAEGEASRFGSNKTDCKWSFSRGDIQTDLVLFIRERTPKMRGDDPMGAALRDFIERGEKVGSSKQLPYLAHTLEGFPAAALSEDFGFNRFSRMRSLAFTQGDRRFFKLTLTHTMTDVGTPLPPISAGELEAAAGALEM